MADLLAATIRPAAAVAPSWRALFLFFALAIYALFGTPTPDAPGAAEFVVGLLLVLATGAGAAWVALRLDAGAGGWAGAARLMLGFGLTVPVAIGIAAGNDPGLMLRDVLSLLFLLLPLFLLPGLQAGGARLRWRLTGAVALVGVAFSLRVLAPAVIDGQPVADIFFLANAPTVLYAALLLAGFAGLALCRLTPPPHFFRSVAYFAAAMLPLAAMVLVTQRASVGYFTLAVLLLLAAGLARRPQRVLAPAIVLLAALYCFWPQAADLLAALLRKTELVGLNMRWQEARAVFEALEGSAFAVIFGKGWGGTVLSPAAGGVVVNFTHNIFTTYWLKTGLAGVVLLGWYLAQAGLALARLLRRQPVVALALGGPFLIDVTLYASFKSLDFGLILLLIALWGGDAAKLHKTGGYSMQSLSP